MDVSTEAPLPSHPVGTSDTPLDTPTSATFDASVFSAALPSTAYSTPHVGIFSGAGGYVTPTVQDAAEILESLLRSNSSNYGHQSMHSQQYGVSHGDLGGVRMPNVDNQQTHRADQPIYNGNLQPTATIGLGIDLQGDPPPNVVIQDMGGTSPGRGSRSFGSSSRSQDYVPSLEAQDPITTTQTGRSRGNMIPNFYQDSNDILGSGGFENEDAHLWDWSRPLPNPPQQANSTTDLLALHGYVDHEGEYGELWREPKGKAAVGAPRNATEVQDPQRPMSQMGAGHTLVAHELQPPFSHGQSPHQEPFQHWAVHPDFEVSPSELQPSLSGNVGHGLHGWKPMQSTHDERHGLHGWKPMQSTHGEHGQYSIQDVPHGFSRHRELPDLDNSATGIEYMEGPGMMDLGED